MKDITKLKNFLEIQYSKQYCHIKDTSLCKTPHNCTCQAAAELLAYYKTIIPHPYYTFSIKDLHGSTTDFTEELITEDLTRNAKKSIIDYCWENIVPYNKDLKEDQNTNLLIDYVLSQKDNDLDKKSTINKRRRQGKNVVIYGESIVYSGNINTKIVSKQRGKTLCASIIMKEAIKSRLLGGTNIIQTYDWESCSQLREKARKFDDESLGEVSDIKMADWLVIDDIAVDRFHAKTLDSFLFERIQERLPTIFVCRFDINKSNTEDEVGAALTKIFHDSNTQLIPLTK